MINQRKVPQEARDLTFMARVNPLPWDAGEKLVKTYLWSPWRTAELQPDRLAVLAGDAACTFGELTIMAERWRHGLARAGMTDGAVIATDIPAGPELFALALAALTGGFGLFPVSRERPDAERLMLLAQANAALDVTCRPQNPLGPVPSLPVAELSVTGHRSGATGANRAGFLVYTTSGTTGKPVAVARSRPWYAYRGVAVMPEYGAGITRGPHIMSDPAFHLGTFGPALYALQAGSPVIVQQDWSASRFCTLVSDYQADSAFVGPGQMLDLVGHGAAPAHAMKVLFHGGSPMVPEIKHKAIGIFGPVVHEFYGTSRGVICEVASEEWLRRPGTVGKPLPGVRVVLKREGAPVPPGETGNLYVRFRAVDSADLAPSYEDTGDIGYIDDAGYVYVLGRAGTGKSARSAILEHLVRELPGVADVAAIPRRTSPDTVTCYIELCAGEAATLLSGHVEGMGRRLGLNSVTVVPRHAGSLPRTPSGKLWRTRLAERKAIND
jgi:long-chain acyl-CoA synthetase